MLSSYDLTIVVDLNKPVVVFPVRAGTHLDQQRNLTMIRSDKRRERDYGTNALRQGLQPSSSRTAASAPTCFLLSIELGPPGLQAFGGPSGSAVARLWSRRCGRRTGATTATSSL